MAKNILIVDDSPCVRTTLRQTLEESGWECAEAVNGKDAIDKAAQRCPELVILDLSMPVMNGLQAARELRRLFPSLPLLMFTSFETARLHREAIAAGVSSLFSKSEPVQKLIDAVHTLLNSLG